MKRWLVRCVAALVAYAVLLVVTGWLAAGCVEDRVRARLAASLDAKVAVRDVSVDLLRGKVTLRGIHIERQEGGHLVVDIDRIDVDVAPMGLVAFLRDADRVSARGARIALSALALRKRPPRPPIRIGELEVRDVELVIMPTSYLPNLGRLAFRIDHGRTTRMELRSALSWVFFIDKLDASVILPVGSRVGVGYRTDSLLLSGSVFGSEPLRVPFPLPRPNPNALEGEQIKRLAKSLGKALVTKAGPALLKRKLDEAWRLVKDL